LLFGASEVVSFAALERLLRLLAELLDLAFLDRFLDPFVVATCAAGVALAAVGRRD